MPQMGPLPWVIMWVMVFTMMVWMSSMLYFLIYEGKVSKTQNMTMKKNKPWLW